MFSFLLCLWRREKVRARKHSVTLEKTLVRLSVRSFPVIGRCWALASRLLTLQCCDKILDTMADLWVALLASTTEMCSPCNQAMKSNFVWKLTGLYVSWTVSMSQVFIPSKTASLAITNKFFTLRPTLLSTDIGRKYSWSEDISKTF